MTEISILSIGQYFRFAVILVACFALTFNRPALAQEDTPSSEVQLPQVAPTPSVSPYQLITRAGAGCDGEHRSDLSGSISFSCPFSSTSVGLKLNPRIDLADGQLIVRAGFARGSDAPLSLDRQLRRTVPATVREGTALTIGGDTTLLQDKLRIESDFAWSRSWSRGLAESPFLFSRDDQRTGSSQRYAAHLTAVDLPHLKWKLDGAVTRADDGFSPGNLSSIATLAMNSGHMDRLASTFQIGGARLGASLVGVRTILARRTTRTISLEYNGLAVALSDRSGGTSPTRQFGAGPFRSRSRALSFDFDFLSLLPMTGVQDRGWRAVIPQQVTAKFGRQEIVRPGNPFHPHDRRETIQVSGMWTSALGDTYVDFSRDRTTGEGEQTERSDQLLLTHSFEVSHWAVNLDLISFRTRTAGYDDDETLSYSVSISRKFADGAKLALRLGSDALSFGGPNNDFSLRDKSRSAKLELDLSAPLQKYLDNRSVRLSLAAQMALNHSGYQLQYLSEVLDEGADNYARQGLLVSFSYAY